MGNLSSLSKSLGNKSITTLFEFLGLYKSFQRHEGSITCFHISHEESIAVTGTSNGMIRLWDLRSKSKNQIWRAKIIIRGTNEEEITGVYLNNPYLIVCIKSGAVIKINLENMKEKLLSYPNYEFPAKMYLHAGKMFFVSTNEAVYLWPYSIETKEKFYENNYKRYNFVGKSRNNYYFNPEGTFLVENDPITDVAFTMRSNMPEIVFIGDEGGKVFSYNVNDKTKYKVFVGHKKKISRIVVTEDQERLCTASFDATINLWNILKKQLLKTLIGNQYGISTFVLKDNLLYSGNVHGDTLCFDTSSGLMLSKSFKNHKGKITAMLCNNNKLYTASRDKLVHCSDAATGELIQEFVGHKGGINYMDFHNGAIYTISEDKTMRQWKEYSKSSVESKDLPSHPIVKTIQEIRKKRAAKLKDLMKPKTKPIAVTEIRTPDGKKIIYKMNDGTWTIQYPDLSVKDGLTDDEMMRLTR